VSLVRLIVLGGFFDRIGIVCIFLRVLLRRLRIRGCDVGCYVNG
jgi:hypothetical protein